MVNIVKDRHIIEAPGKSEVIIEDGEIVSIGEPIIDYCPIFKKIDGVDHFSKDFIRENINKRMREFGYCTRDRIVKMDDVMTFGISEILRTNVELGEIDCVVGACDGVGTLIMTDSDIIQGVGGRVSGLVNTTPIPEVIEKVGKDNVINPDTAQMDPIKGLDEAINRGYKNIAITLIPTPIIKEIREHKVPDDVNVYLFIAHTTGVSREFAQLVFEYADVVTACSSLKIHEVAQELKPYYSGKKVPIFATTKMGRKFLDNRLKAINKPVSTNEYPIDKENCPNPLL